MFCNSGGKAWMIWKKCPDLISPADGLVWSRVNIVAAAPRRGSGWQNRTESGHKKK
jgi:hypothetical protein